jgi:hypothetical protein
MAITSFRETCYYTGMAQRSRQMQKAIKLMASIAIAITLHVVFFCSVD